MNHQFNLFPFEDIRPKTKIPISAKRIQEAKEALAKRDVRGVLEGLRYINDKLENYERRIFSGKTQKP